MSDILVLTHVDYCPAAYLGEFLDARGESWREVRCDLGELDGVDLDQPKAVAIMGGGMSVNDPLPWIAEEVKALQHFIARDIPLIGHCLGGQLLARALGAPVQHMGYNEAGWQPMRRLTASPWLAHLPDEFPIYQWHNDSFAIPAGAVHLLSSPWCTNQGFSWGDKLLALQGHPEMTVQLIEEWFRDAGHLLDETQPSQEKRVQTREALPEKVAAMNRLAEGLYSHWLGLANS
jgi:GMP synthase-like glutamine amidotransferase